MKILLPVIVLSFFSIQLSAQDYFPLAPGNEWKLAGTESDDTTVVYEISDTAVFRTHGYMQMPNGKEYAILNQALVFGKYVRADSDFIYFYDPSDSSDVPVFDLTAQQAAETAVRFGSPSSEYSVYLGEIYQDTLFGKTTNVRQYWISSGNPNFMKRIAFSDIFGPVRYSIRYQLDSTSAISEYLYELSSCYIDEIAYGSDGPRPAVSLPLTTGNKWTFFGTGSECYFNELGEGICLLIELRDTLTFSVLEDTVMQNGKEYFKIETKSLASSYGFEANAKLISPFFIRSDENYVYLYDRSAETEVPFLNLQGNLYADDTVHFGISQDIEYNIWIGSFYKSSAFGDNINSIEYYIFELDTMKYVGSDVYKVSVSDKYGFTSFSQFYWPGDTHEFESEIMYTRYGFNYDLVSCIIDSVNYLSISAEDEPNSPQSFTLSQNYPNPFNPITTIEFSVPKAAHVKLVVYDILGREVYVLANDYYATGSYKVSFNGAGLPSGVYFYNLQADGFTQTRKFVLLK